MCVCIRLQNLCFALKDKEGGMGNQSVPLQINSLIPGSIFSPKHPLSPASASLPPSPPSLPLLHHSLQLLHYCFCTLTVFLLLSVNQATYMGCCGFVWESDESLPVGGAEIYPILSPQHWSLKAFLFRQGQYEE